MYIGDFVAILLKDHQMKSLRSKNNCFKEMAHLWSVFSELVKAESPNTLAYEALR